MPPRGAGGGPGTLSPSPPDTLPPAVPCVDRHREQRQGSPRSCRHNSREPRAGGSRTLVTGGWASDLAWTRSFRPGRRETGGGATPAHVIVAARGKLEGAVRCADRTIPGRATSAHERPGTIDRPGRGPPARRPGRPGEPGRPAPSCSRSCSPGSRRVRQAARRGRAATASRRSGARTADATRMRPSRRSDPAWLAPAPSAANGRRTPRRRPERSHAGGGATQREAEAESDGGAGRGGARRAAGARAGPSLADDPELVREFVDRSREHLDEADASS